MVVNSYDAFIKYFPFMAQDNFIYNFHSLLNTAEWLFNRWFEAAFFQKDNDLCLFYFNRNGSSFWAHCWPPAYLDLLLLLNCSPHNTIHCIYYTLYYFVVHNTTLGVHLLPYTLMTLSLSLCFLPCPVTPTQGPELAASPQGTQWAPVSPTLLK